MPDNIDRLPRTPTRTRRAFEGIGSVFVPYTGAWKDVDLGTFNLTTTGIITGEQVTSTDDITMQGHLLTLGDGSATDIVISFSASANDGTLTFDESDNEFDFGSSLITTTGALGCGTITLTANSDIEQSGTGHITAGSEGFIVGTLTITDGTIDDTDGAITFGDTNLTTTGTITGEQLTSTDDITAGDSFFASDGVVGTPSYSFTSDLDTGMYYLAVGEGGPGIRFAVGGALQFDLIAGAAHFQGNDIYTTGDIYLSADGGTLYIGAGFDASFNFDGDSLNIAVPAAMDIEITTDDFTIIAPNSRAMFWDGGQSSLMVGSTTNSFTTSNYSFICGYNCDITDGYGSMAIGSNVNATTSWATAMGKDFTNATSQSFMVGYSATPAIIITNNQLEIPDTSALILATKSTTGDPTGVEGKIYCNTFDNKIRVYSDGAWRDLATW